VVGNVKVYATLEAVVLHGLLLLLLMRYYLLLVILSFVFILDVLVIIHYQFLLAFFLLFCALLLEPFCIKQHLFVLLYLFYGVLTHLDLLLKFRKLTTLVQENL